MIRKVIIVFLLISAWIGVFGMHCVRAQPTDAAAEYKIKAAFLLNFAKFITWPEDSFAEDNAPFKVCVLGEDPFGTALSTIESRTVANRKVDLYYVNSLEEAIGCHLLFISASEKNNLASIRETLKDLPITTVSDIEGFAEHGGIIEFLTREDKVAFTINLNRARKQRLNIPSALLSLATKVIQ